MQNYEGAMERTQPGRPENRAALKTFRDKEAQREAEEELRIESMSSKDREAAMRALRQEQQIYNPYKNFAAFNEALRHAKEKLASGELSPKKRSVFERSIARAESLTDQEKYNLYNKYSRNLAKIKKIDDERLRAAETNLIYKAQDFEAMSEILADVRLEEENASLKEQGFGTIQQYSEDPDFLFKLLHIANRDLPEQVAQITAKKMENLKREIQDKTIDDADADKLANDFVAMLKLQEIANAGEQEKLQDIIDLIRNYKFNHFKDYNAKQVESMLKLDAQQGPSPDLASKDNKELYRTHEQVLHEIFKDRFQEIDASKLSEPLKSKVLERQKQYAPVDEEDLFADIAS